MTEAKDAAEQHAKYNMNFRIDITDTAIIAHFPCPGCGEPDFQIAELLTLAETTNTTCQHCNRSFTIMWTEGVDEPDIIKTSGPPLAPWVDLPELH